MSAWIARVAGWAEDALRHYTEREGSVGAARDAGGGLGAAAWREVRSMHR